MEEEILKIINEMIDNFDKRFIESSVYNHYAEGARNALQELKAKVSQIDCRVKPACETIVAQLRKILEDVPDEGRLHIFSEIQDGYCKHCGSKYLPCYCNNDD